MKVLLLIISVLFAMGTAIAASKAPKGNAGASDYKPFKMHDYRGKTQWTSAKLHKKQLRAAKRRGKKRRPAGALSESMMSEPYKEFRDKILAADTPQKLQTLLIKARVEFDYVERQAKANGGNYPDTWPEDKRFFVAQVIPVIASRSLYYRLRPLLEFHDRDKKNEGLVHSLTVTFARNVASAVDLMLPYQHSKAAFKYISEPFHIPADSPLWAAVDKVVDQYGQGTPDEKKAYKAQLRAQEAFEAKRTFSIAQEVQDFMRNETYPLLQDCERRVKSIDLSNKNVVWDNKFVFGFDYDNPAGVDPLDRFRRVGEREKNAVVAALNAGMAAVLGATAYNADGTIEIVNEIGTQLGVDAVIPGLSRLRGVVAEGLSPRDRYKYVIEFDRNDKFGQLRKDSDYTFDGSGATQQRRSRVDLAQAFLHVRESVLLTDLIRAEVDRLGTQPEVVLDPAIFTAFRRVNRLGMSHIKALFAPPGGGCAGLIEGLAGELTKEDGDLEARASSVLALSGSVDSCVVDVTSATSGQKVSANVVKMYLSPIADIRYFMPGAKVERGKLKFEDSMFNSSYPSDSMNQCKSRDFKTCKRTVAGEEVEFRNYHHGVAEKWSTDVYKTYFPNVSSSDDLKRANQILSQTWGGWVLGGPLAGFML